MDNLKKPENDIQLLRILQRRHIFQRPIEMLVKVLIHTNNGKFKRKEIWLSKTYIQSQEGGKFLIEEFSKTKVSERGVDMYLGRRRSINVQQDQNKQNEMIETSVSSATYTNFQTNKIKKTASLPSSISMTADNCSAKNTEVENNINNSINLRLKKSNTSNTSNKSFKKNFKSIDSFKLSNIRNNLKNRRINSLTNSKKNHKSGQDVCEAFEDGNTCSDDGVTYVINNNSINKVNTKNHKKYVSLSNVNAAQSSEKVLMHNDQRKQTTQNNFSQKNKLQNKKKCEPHKIETKRKKKKVPTATLR